MVTEHSKISTQVKQLLALLIISLNNNAGASSTYYLVPRQCPNCHTLNEVIENGISIYGSNVRVVLLPGLHVINSTKNKFLIENIGSLMLTGQGETAVKCLHEFSFNFSEIEDVIVSHIRFESCSALTNFDQNDVVISRSTKLRNTFLLMNVQNINIENLIINDGGLAVIPKYVTDIKFRFQGINISSGQLGIYVTKQGGFGVPDGNLLIHVHDCVFKNAFVDVITTRADIDQLEMRKVSYVDKIKSSYPVLYVVNVRKVHLNTVHFQNNSSPLLEMIGIDLTVIKGYCSFKFNFGMGGALIRTTNFSLYPYTTFEMTFNNVKKSPVSYTHLTLPTIYSV